MTPFPHGSSPTDSDCGSDLSRQLSFLQCTSPSTASSLSTLSFIQSPAEILCAKNQGPSETSGKFLSIPNEELYHSPWSPTISSFALCADKSTLLPNATTVYVVKTSSNSAPFEKVMNVAETISKKDNSVVSMQKCSSYSTSLQEIKPSTFNLNLAPKHYDHKGVCLSKSASKTSKSSQLAPGKNIDYQNTSIAKQTQQHMTKGDTLLNTKELNEDKALVKFDSSQRHHHNHSSHHRHHHHRHGLHHHHHHHRNPNCGEKSYNVSKTLSYSNQNHHSDYEFGMENKTTVCIPINVKQVNSKFEKSPLISCIDLGSENPESLEILDDKLEEYCEPNACTEDVLVLNSPECMTLEPSRLTIEPLELSIYKLVSMLVVRN